VGRQTVDQLELDQFLDDHEIDWTYQTDHESELLVETAGRLCYMSFANPRPGGIRAYMENILNAKHGSVLEHSVWNFIITGVSRSFTHELVRHRAGFGYSQLSQRYVDESQAEYVVPDVIRNDPMMYKIWLSAVEEAHNSYIELVDLLTTRYKDIEDRTHRRKLARQAARSVLPNATETKIFVTANGRALRHFLEMRGSVHAELEIRKVASLIHVHLMKDAPDLFGDFNYETAPDGGLCLVPKYSKV